MSIIRALKNIHNVYMKNKNQNKQQRKRSVNSQKTNAISKDASFSIALPIDNTGQLTLNSSQILQLFKSTFQETFTNDYKLTNQIQTVKGDLYNRDYLKAFGSSENREAYVVRWTPARALCYTSVYSNINPIRTLLQDKSIVNVLSIGGGAGSEIIGLTSSFSALNNGNANHKLHVHVVDIADWSDIVEKIDKYIQLNWVHKDKIKGDDTALCLKELKINDSAAPIQDIKISFQHDDILNIPSTQVKIPFSELNLITLMFTTNELFAASKVKTIELLKNITEQCKEGTLLLITESAGSYSEVKVGTKMFPVQMLTDHTLCGINSNGPWEIVSQNDSIWYRLEENLNYPLRLENMRFFYRLYEKQCKD